MKAVLPPLRARLAMTLLAIATLSLVASASAAEPQQETRAATGFHRIDIDGKFEVVLVQGDAEGVTVEGPAALLPRVRTEVKAGTLVVDMTESSHSSVWDWFSGRSSSRTPRVTVRLRELDRIEAAGAVTLTAESLKLKELRLDLAGACTVKIGELQASTLNVDGSGAIKVSVGGKVGRQKIDLSGAGSYLAEGLASDDTVVEVSGAGKAVVNAKNSLAVDISGAGKVEYLGDPKLKQSISGIGKISRRDRS
jgi:hypothetical protein